MSVNSFSDEDSIRAAYDAVERCLWHFWDKGDITFREVGRARDELISQLSVRIADAVMHSGVEDISEVVPGIVERVEEGGGRQNGQGRSVPWPTIRDRRRRVSSPSVGDYL